MVFVFDLQPVLEDKAPQALATWTGMPRVAQCIAASHSRVFFASGGCEIECLEWDSGGRMFIGLGETLSGQYVLNRHSASPPPLRVASSRVVCCDAPQSDELALLLSGQA